MGPVMEGKCTDGEIYGVFREWEVLHGSLLKLHHKPGRGFLPVDEGQVQYFTGDIHAGNGYIRKPGGDVQSQAAGAAAGIHEGAARVMFFKLRRK